MVLFTVDPEPLDPFGDYLTAVDDDNKPEPEDINQLLTTGGRDLDAGTIVGAARTIAAAAHALAAAVTDPYGLRTVNDVARVVDAIGATAESLGATAAGLVAWLSAAEKRGELAGPTGPAVGSLVRISGQFIGNPIPPVPDLPGDASPGMELAEVVAEVTARLRALDVPVDDPVVAETGVSWQIGDDLSLSLVGGFGGWGLFEPSPGEPGMWRGIVGDGLPSATYAHPALVAERVAAYVRGRVAS